VALGGPLDLWIMSKEIPQFVTSASRSMHISLHTICLPSKTSFSRMHIKQLAYEI